MPKDSFSDEFAEHLHSQKFELANLDEEDFDDELPTSRKSKKIIFAFIGVLIVSVGAFLLGEHFKSEPSVKLVNGVVEGGTVSKVGVLTETELRDLVKSAHITAYWVGPIAGYKYTLYVPKTGVVVIRYLPDGKGLNDTSPNYRVIGTYAQKDATASVESAGKKDGSVGFTNIDGNAVFYVRARPTNVYMAVKGKDIQIEIFDPGADQALALALFRGKIEQIK